MSLARHRTSVDETPRAVGRRAGRRWRAPATSCCSPATSARARPPSPRASARGLGVDEPITSPTFTLVRTLRGPAARCTTSTSTGSTTSTRCSTSAWPSCSTTAASCSSSGATPSRPRCPPTSSRSASRFGAGDDDRVAVDPSARAGRGAGRRAADALPRGGRSVAWAGRVLILGIDTATPQVGCAIGGHEGVLGLVHSPPGPAPRRDARARPSSSCATRPASSSTRSAPSPSTSAPGLFTGLRVGHRHGQGDGATRCGCR